MAPSGDQGVRGARNTTVAATQVRQRRRDGVEKRSRRGGRNKRDGSGEEGAAAEERFRGHRKFLRPASAAVRAHLGLHQMRDMKDGRCKRGMREVPGWWEPVATHL